MYAEQTIQAVVARPSGLVPRPVAVLCSADGKWIAHGDGDADRETATAKNCPALRVDPKYTLSPRGG